METRNIEGSNFMKRMSPDQQAKLISFGLFLGLIVFAAAFSLWSNRHAATASRLEALREAARTNASRTSDAMRDLHISVPEEPSDDEQVTRPKARLSGRCLVLNSYGDLDKSRLPVAHYNAWLADSWRAKQPEDVSFLIWLNWPKTSRSSWIQFDGNGKVTATSSEEWNDDIRERCRVVVTKPDGEILREFTVAAEAVNGPIPELRSFEASLMQEIAAGLNEDLWSVEILKQLQSRRYER